MYNVLIVEDVPAIRAGIAQLVKNFKDESFIIYEAPDGHEALNIIRSIPLDIIITDIQMPRQDGLQLVENACKHNPNLKFIIFSGYADFHYAQKAIHLGVHSYLLKPVDPLELYKVLESIVDDLRTKKVFSQQLEHAKTLEKQQLLHHLITTALTSEDPLEQEHSLKRLLQNGFDINNSCCLALLRVNANDNGQRSKIRLNWKQNITAACPSAIPFHPSATNRFLGVLFYHNSHIGLNHILKTFIEFAAETVSTAPCLIGFSSIHTNLCPQLYIEAQNALHQKLCKTHPFIFYYTDIEDSTEPRMLLAPLKQNLAHKNRCESTAILQQIFSELIQAPPRRKTLLLLVQQLCAMIIDAFNLSTEDISKYHLLDKNLLDHFDSLEYLHLHFNDILEANLPHNTCLSEKDIYLQTHKTIQTNYTRQLSVTEMAEALYISPSYLSNIYKKYSGHTISDTLRKLRLEKAADLLAHTEFSINTIAEAIGYSDLQYFYRLFKKYFHTTPMTYRQQNKI